MKLAAIYNVFGDSTELLAGSMACLKDHVDVFVMVYQTTSNFGEESMEILNHLTPEGLFGIGIDKVQLIKFDPRLEIGGMMNERAKRNLGVNAALNSGCTHFLNIDCDEYYEDFGAAKQMYLDSGHKGSVVRLWTYFKKPTLRVDKPEDYFVPFIHELHDKTNCGTSTYPFWCDPTRNVNESDVVCLPIHMDHYSWVRLDIEMKCRNSSARENIKNGTMLKDYHSPEVGPGFYVNDWQRKLIEVPDKYNLSPIFET